MQIANSIGKNLLAVALWIPAFIFVYFIKKQRSGGVYVKK